MAKQFKVMGPRNVLGKMFSPLGFSIIPFCPDGSFQPGIVYREMTCLRFTIIDLILIPCDAAVGFDFWRMGLRPKGPWVALCVAVPDSQHLEFPGVVPVGEKER